MKESLRKASQKSKLTARGREKNAKPLFLEGASSSPRASLAFSVLAVVRTFREMFGDLCRRFAFGRTSKQVHGSVRYSSRS
jgi:hypothetical protein